MDKSQPFTKDNGSGWKPLLYVGSVIGNLRHMADFNSGKGRLHKIIHFAFLIIFIIIIHETVNNEIECKQAVIKEDNACTRLQVDPRAAELAAGRKRNAV